MEDESALSEPATVPLWARHAANIDLDRAFAVLGELSWLGRPVDGLGSAEFRRVATDLELPIHDGSSTGPVAKAAFIDLGAARSSGDSILVDVSWQSASFAPLFPVFAGRLSVIPEGLILNGRYAPPFGKVGMLIDHALLHLVARRTASGLLARLARQFKA
jgi:hypothetical protein